MMAAERANGRPSARITWTSGARPSFMELIAYLRTHEYGDPASRASEIILAIEKLEYSPRRCPVVRTRCGKSFRCLVVARRFLVYYIYFASRSVREAGRVSIRAVKHGARRRPFAGVREPELEEWRQRAMNLRQWSTSLVTRGIRSRCGCSHTTQNAFEN